MSHGNDSVRFHRFLNEYCEKLKDKKDAVELPIPVIRFTNPRIATEEIEGECLEWCLNFLTTRQCPAILATALAREVYKKVSACNLIDFLNEEEKDIYSTEISRPASGEAINKPENEDKEYRADALHTFVMTTLETLILAWTHDLPSFNVPSTVYECSIHAIKNTRRNMEDCHLIVPDLNTLFGLEAQPNQSFYAVFDGHAGVGAATYAARQLHCNLVRRCCLETHPEAALKSAYKMTDELFTVKARKQNWRSGSTCVSALIRNGMLHLAWLGDSQAVLVRDGRVVTHLEPHKPDRQDERDRIEALGGCVLIVGDMWRVGGNLAVSRAIGDVSYKPFVSSECDVITVELNGLEDYVVLACDGAWDAIRYDTLPGLVYNHLAETDNDHASVAKMLVQYAKDNDSTDNISIIVVFFREKIAVPKSDAGLFDFLGTGASWADNSHATDYHQDTTCHVADSGRINTQPQGDNGLGDNSTKNNQDSQVLPFTHGAFPSSEKPYPGDVDPDYYGVFDTRLVDGPVDLPFLDMPNSSDLLKDIAETMYSGHYDVMIPEVYIRPKNENRQQIPESDSPKKKLDLTIAADKVSKPNVEYVYEKQRIHKYNRKGMSPVCWAFTGKNRASVQNYRLNQAAKSSLRGSISLSELSTAAKSVGKNKDIPKITRMLQGNEIGSKYNKTTHSYIHPPGITIFGSKTNIQTESKKFHTSWRPRKPLKPVCTIVYDPPPSPFVQNKLDGIR